MKRVSQSKIRESSILDRKTRHFIVTFQKIVIIYIKMYKS